MKALGPLERLEAFVAAASSLVPAIEGAAIAVGWATVELDRAASELTMAMGLQADAVAAADDDELLGARCRIALGVLAEGRSLVILEPATEGRLAATLARFGEGPAVLWMAAHDPAERPVPARVDGVTWSSTRSGPLGLERLLLGGPIHGPHRLVLGPPGTIRS